MRCYCELEEGLWVIITEIEFKKNVSTYALPIDCYSLSHIIPTHGWAFYKSGTEFKTSLYKGDFISFAFNAGWFERNIPVNKFSDRYDFKSFFESTDTAKTWGNIVPGSEILISKILAILRHENEGQEGIILLKLLCLQVISLFFASMAAVPTIKLHDQDSRLVERAEKALVDNLLIGFPGIVELTAMLYTSSTKIQLLFKAVHGNSMYQYYQEKQMELALQLLKTSRRSTKDIALTFGYKNPSKFSAAFKKYHHVLPSKIVSP